MENSFEIVGPPNEEHKSVAIPENVRLADGVPLYYLFLPDYSGAVDIDPKDVQAAKGVLAGIIRDYSEKVFACEGKSIEEARKILEIE